MKQPLFFRIYKNGQLLEIKQIQGEQAVIGSNDDVEVSLKDESVSPIHAMVEERESGYFICDLGSSSGTQKNGKGILDDSIQSGDEIKVGPYTIEFYVGVPKPKSKPPRVSAAPPPGAPSDKDDIYDAPTRVIDTPKPAPRPHQPVEFEAPKKDVKIELENPKRPMETVAKPQKNQGEAPAAKVTPKPVTTQPSKSFGGGVELHTLHKPAKGRNWGRTYAPPSAHKDLRKVLKPTKGTVVEVVVAWKERIIDSFHYSEKRTIYVGSHPKNEIVLPVFGSTTVSHPLVKIEGAARIFVTSDLKGELVQGDTAMTLQEALRRGRGEASGTGQIITLQQGEVIRVDFGDSVCVYVRYVNQAPKPVAAPFLDLSTGEVSGVIGAFLLAALMGFYLAVYQPRAPVEEVKLEEPPRRATFLYKAQIEPINVEQEKAPAPENAKLAEKETPKQEKAPVKAPTPQKAASRDEEGKASEARPNKSTSQEKKLTTPNPGKGQGIQKASVNAKANKSDAQGGSAQKDVTKTGLLSVLSGKGAQDQLSKAYSGAGVVGGLSQNATGSGAQSAVGAGDTPGEGLKDIGKGGKGEATVGIAGVNTKGRGSGNEGYGTGSIGDKKNATVIPGGAEEAFSGSIDREAIRRVILNNMRQIKACYERALNRDPSLHGKILLAWVIGDKGIVTSASVASTTMNSAEVEQCMVSRLRTWRFPEPPAGQEAEVTYPFVFTAQN